MALYRVSLAAGARLTFAWTPQCDAPLVGVWDDGTDGDEIHTLLTPYRQDHVSTPDAAAAHIAAYHQLSLASAVTCTAIWPVGE